MIFILSFAVFGASGVSRPFPAVSGVVMHAKLLVLGLTVAYHSGRAILPKGTSITVTEMVRWDEALGYTALNVTTPWE